MYEHIRAVLLGFFDAHFAPPGVDVAVVPAKAMLPGDKDRNP
jgi:hypothetical protein